MLLLKKVIRRITLSEWRCYGTQIKSLVSTFYKLFVSMLDTLVLASFKYSKHTEMVLLVRLDAIGDFILWLDSAQHFRKIYPDKKLFF